jgi:hypothetical protein
MSYFKILYLTYLLELIIHDCESKLIKKRRILFKHNLRINTIYSVKKNSDEHII